MNLKIMNLKDSEKLSKMIAKNRKRISPFILLLDGQLGAGKTQMSKFIAKDLKIKEKIKSPTFNILKTYKRRNFVLTHIDAYRLENNNSDIGLEEIILSSDFVIIEWPFFIEKFLPKQYLLLNMKILDKNKREVILKSKGKEYENIAKEIIEKWED